MQHARAMLSLDNAFSYDALRDFDRRVREGIGREKIEYIAEHKFDGLSISLQYAGGKACARRYARRWNDRRRRHAQCENDPVDSAANGCGSFEEGKTALPISKCAEKC